MNSLDKKAKILIEEINDNGLFKNERIITSQQDSEIIANNNSVLNFCANNYLGLSNNQHLINYAKEGIDK